VYNKLNHYKEFVMKKVLATIGLAGLILSLPQSANASKPSWAGKGNASKQERNQYLYEMREEKKERKNQKEMERNEYNQEKKWLKEERKREKEEYKKKQQYQKQLRDEEQKMEKKRYKDQKEYRKNRFEDD
jgi:flagellar biosynthesis GTPase FlhF